MPFGDGKLLSKVIGARFPVAGAILEAITPEIVDVIRKQPADRPIGEVMNAIAPQVQKIADDNPEIKNDLNLEHPVQSRVVQGTTWAIVAGVGASVTHLISMAEHFQIFAFDYATAGLEIAAIVGGVYTLYGRLAGGLQPLNFLWLFGKKKTP